MTEDESRSVDPDGMECEPRSEGDVIDEHAIRGNVRNDADQFVEYPVGFVEQVVASGICLVEQRGDRSSACCLEERPQMIVLAERLFLGTDDTRITALAEAQMRPFEPSGFDEWAHRLASGNDHVIPCLAPGNGDLEHRDRV